MPVVTVRMFLSPATFSYVSAGKELDLSQNGESQANNMVGGKCIKDAFKRVVM